MQGIRASGIHAATLQRPTLSGRRQIGHRSRRTRSTPLKRLLIRPTAPCAVHCNTSAWLARLSTPARGADNRLRHETGTHEPSSLRLEQPLTSSTEQSRLVYTLQTLQHMLAGGSDIRSALVEARLVAKLLQLTHGRALSGVGASEHLGTGQLSIAEQESVSQLALDVLSLLLMCNGEVDSRVLEQLLDAQAVLHLTKLVSSETMAADLLCVMAIQAQCKEAFLEAPILQLLVELMTDCPKTSSVSRVVAGRAAAVLWRAANNYDKAKLEFVKAGAVAPAVALLNRAREDAASATEAAYLLAVLAEHHSTHQAITAQQTVPALLHILHAAHQPHTSSQTLDRPSPFTPSLTAVPADATTTTAAASQPHTTSQTHHAPSSPQLDVAVAPATDVASIAVSSSTTGHASGNELAAASSAVHGSVDPDSAAVQEQVEASTSGAAASDENAQKSIEDGAMSGKGNVMAEACMLAASVAETLSGVFSAMAIGRLGKLPSSTAALRADNSTQTASGSDSSLTAVVSDKTKDSADTACISGPADSAGEAAQTNDAMATASSDSVSNQTALTSASELVSIQHREAGSEAASESPATPATASDLEGNAETAFASVSSSTACSGLPQRAAATISRLQKAAATAAQHSLSTASSSAVSALGSLGNRTPSGAQQHAAETGAGGNLNVNVVSRQQTEDSSCTGVCTEEGSGSRVSGGESSSSVRRKRLSNADRLQRDRLLVAANAALLSLLDNADTHFAAINEGAAPALVTTLQYGSMNAQAMACNSLQAIAASDRRHAAVFARAGAVPWLVGLVRQSPHHACGGNAAAALREILQDQGYHSEACACGVIPALVAMLKSNDITFRSAAASALCTLASATLVSRKKAISRAGGLAGLVSMVQGLSPEGTMHAAQALLHLAKLPDLKVLIVQAGAVAAIVHHLNSSAKSCSCNVRSSKPASSCFCACSTAAAARLLGRLCSNDIAQMQLKAFDPLPALLYMMTGGCRHPVEYYDMQGNELQQPCEKNRMIMSSAAQYALIKIASHCDEDLREHMLHECIAQSWMGHDIAYANMLFL